MAKAIRIFEFRLKSNVKADEFERFVIEELTKAPSAPGIKIRFLKCDRDSQGDLTGTYANELEFESTEVRDRYFPTATESSEEFNQWWAEHGTLWEKFYSMVEGHYVDYIDYGK